MLHTLDGILNFIFYSLPPLLFGLGVAVGAVLAVITMSQARSNVLMVEAAAGCLVLAGLCFSFFPYRASFASTKAAPPTVEKMAADGSMQIVPMGKKEVGVIENVLAMLLVAVSAVGVIVLRAIHVPFVVLVFVVWGIILCGW